MGAVVSRGGWRTGLLAGLLLAGTVSLPTPAPAAAGGKRVALVIDGGPGTAANGSVMAGALRHAGFTVTRIDHPGRVALESALERFREALSGAELGFVYYSGPAVGLGEREYLLPADADPGSADDLPRQTLDLDGVLSDLRESGRRAVVVIDPTESGAAARRVGGGALGQPLEADGLFLVYAHRPGVDPVGTDPAPREARKADAFTAALAREMVKPGVTFRDSLAEVARAVAERSGGRQLPWLQDRLSGDLVLVPAVAAAPKPAAKGTPPTEGIQEAPREPPAVTTATLPPGTYAMARAGALFDRPAVGARGVARLPAGTAVTVLGPAPGGSWLRVRDAQGRTGYVTAGALAARWIEPTPLAARRGTVEAGPSLDAPDSSSDSGASDPGAGSPNSDVSVPAQRGFAAPPPGEDPAARAAEQRAMRAVGDARTAAERARSTPDGRYWSHAFPGGDRYDGSWTQPGSLAAGLERPLRQGYGVYRFANGRVYEGEWADDLMAGHGVLTFPDGSRYAGQFRDGHPDGPGVMQGADGRQDAARWNGDWGGGWSGAR